VARRTSLCAALRVCGRCPSNAKSLLAICRILPGAPIFVGATQQALFESKPVWKGQGSNLRIIGWSQVARRTSLCAALRVCGRCPSNAKSLLAICRILPGAPFWRLIPPTPHFRRRFWGQAVPSWGQIIYNIAPLQTHFGAAPRMRRNSLPGTKPDGPFLPESAARACNNPSDLRADGLVASRFAVPVCDPVTNTDE